MIHNFNIIKKLKSLKHLLLYYIIGKKRILAKFFIKKAII